MDKQWYQSGWTLDMKSQSWTENTETQVDFLVNSMQLRGNERILDLACGYGRHALVFAQRGYTVVGVDITQELIDDANRNAPPNASFLCKDIRDVDFSNEFDVVLNLADGAIGYLEDDAENLKMFDVIARALKPGGKHFMDVCNAEHAELYFPKRHWQVGEHELALAAFNWVAERRRMQFGGGGIRFGEVAKPPEPSLEHQYGTRLYTRAELQEIFAQRGMEIRATYSDYHGTPADAKHLQLMVYSQKR